MNNKINAVAKAVTLLLATASTAAHADLVITEYVEGGGSNKAIEISNLGDSNIDLDAAQYAITLYSNGSTEAGNSSILTGTLAPGSSIVYHNGSADDAFKVGIESTVTYFNGDDALLLTKDGVVIDRFGKLGEDPGSEWTDANDANFSTKDKTLRRKASITTGDTNASADFPGTDNQWVVFDKDTSDGLGCPGEGACTAEPGVLIITEYVEGGGSNKAVELSNVGGSSIDLDASVYTLSLYGNGSTDAGNTETLTGILAAGESIVFHNSSADDVFKVGTESTVTYFNGDDALVLYKDDVVIDRLGKLGEDPGSEWTDPNDPDFSTKDKTLRRKNSITAGDTDATAAFPGDNNQWVTFDKDTADGLGCMGESACGSTPVDPEPEPEGPCSGCDELTPVADPATFDANVYYTNVLSGSFDDAEAMKNAISVAITAGHTQLSYKQVWTALTYSDEDPSNSSNVIELYTGLSVSKQNNGGNTSDWNREHVWAKSHGFPSESQLGYTDAHHLRPTNVKVNSTRSNYDFNECSDTGTEVADAPGNYLDAGARCFEPRDAIKGDVARMIMYMDTRYQGNDSNMPDLIAVDRITTADEVSNNDPLHGKLCTLYDWHQQDPVDAKDITRNDAIYQYQGNRNPYIDYPEWVQEVYGDQCGDPINPSLDVDVVIEAPEQVNETETLVLDASATVAEDGSDLTFSWEQTAGPELTFDGSAAILSVTAPEVSVDTQIAFTLTVSDGMLETTQVVAVTVVNVPLSFDISFSGNTELNEGDSTVITAAIADEPAGLVYSWKQVSGADAEYSADGLVLSVTAPEVTVDQALVFELVVTDGDEQFTTSVSVNVNNTLDEGWTKPEGAGSLGAGLLMLLPLLWRRRQS
ncbi:endonuclease [Shewanella sp. 1_MG-2023]|uniref:endonuclease n=1 Tax=unclassified Shewanella TaxID=196818 RepID=UPI0026E3AFE0|nr:MULTISPECIES: endonuclease [unclassified Shewanella]MDO6610419.1 endonuclease [Shewanella sp. 7_MG-2023]MDO6770544.1 endonuclease [Shewanella sp. 2_MG-2023]MDO6794431.1 endonuclease [Shewanella sp. 1_MG-2023]